VKRWVDRWPYVLVVVVLAGAAVGAFVSYSDVGSGGTTAQRVGAWVRAADLGGSIGTVAGDLARAATAIADRRSATILHTDCGVLVSDVGAANGDLPSPDSRLTNLLSAAYTDAYQAGNDCYDAAGHAGMAASFRTERARSLSRLQEALALVRQLTGSSLSTTTTTQPGGGGIFG
jgi:hypothetical protein